MHPSFPPAAMPALPSRVRARTARPARVLAFALTAGLGVALWLPAQDAGAAGKEPSAQQRARKANYDDGSTTQWSKSGKKSEHAGAGTPGPGGAKPGTAGGKPYTGSPTDGNGIRKTTPAAAKGAAKGASGAPSKP